MSEVDLRATLAGVELANPVLLASGTCGYGAELEPFLDLTELGGIVAKSLTLEPREGNEPPRITETPAGMLNAISLENIGVDAFLRDRLPALPPELVVIAVASRRRSSATQKCASDSTARPECARWRSTQAART